MTKQILKICVLGLIAAAVAVTPIRVSAEGTNQPSAENKKPAEKKPQTLSFRGKLSAVDKVQMTITVGEQTFQITSETKITKDGKPAILNDGVVGENVGGAYKKTDDGKLTATTVNFGTKPKITTEKKPKEQTEPMPPKEN